MKSHDALIHFNKLLDDLGERRGAIYTVYEIWALTKAMDATLFNFSIFYPDIVTIYNRVHGTSEVELD